ncbi:helix-turn-helix domain-containing protein [Roseibium sp. M-1]
MISGVDGHKWPGPALQAIQGAGWRAELLPRAPYEARYTPEGPIVGFAFDPQTGDHAFASDRSQAFEARPNGFAYLPAGCDVYSRSGTGGEYLRIAFSRLAGEKTPAQRFSSVVDPAATKAAHRLRREILLQDKSEPLVVEALVQDLESAAMRLLSGTASDDPAGRWMTPRRLNQVEALIEARYADALTVADLADALGLSVDFFSRAFRAATGRAPRAYIIDRRIRHAREMLQGTDATLAIIACASGFASHAHMTLQFRQRLGLCPSDFRGR